MWLGTCASRTGMTGGSQSAAYRSAVVYNRQRQKIRHVSRESTDSIFPVAVDVTKASTEAEPKISQLGLSVFRVYIAEHRPDLKRGKDCEDEEFGEEGGEEEGEEDVRMVGGGWEEEGEEEEGEEGNEEEREAEDGISDDDDDGDAMLGNMVARMQARKLAREIQRDTQREANKVARARRKKKIKY
eukprot:scaffold8183_cov122-Isochrysis_galbana.AAC.13